MLVTPFYRPLTKSQKAAIQNAITTKYSRPEDIGAYSYETARARTEIVLLNALVRNAKDSERSYIYLSFKGYDQIIKGTQLERSTC